MAVGFIPKHSETISGEGLSKEHILALFLKTAQALSWKLSYISKSGIIAYTDNGLTAWNGEVTVKLEGDSISIKSESTGSDLIDFGKNKKAVRSFIDTFGQQKAALDAATLDAEYELHREGLDGQQEDALNLPPETASQKVKGFLGIFVPVEGYRVTPILLAINILIFIVMALTGAGIMEPDTDTLIAWGANFKPITLEGQWWRLLTACFIHIGILHLLMNMYALLYIGVLLEPLLGTARFLAAYLLTGLMASLASLWWHDMTVSAGASGAIFGMYGVFLALLTTHLIEKESRQSLLASIGMFVAYNLLFGMKGGVDNAAHIGGLLSGLLVGYAFVPSLKHQEHKLMNRLTIGILAVALISLSVIVYINMPNAIGSYQARLDRFTALEERALSVATFPENMPVENQLSAIKQGTKDWQEAQQVIASCNELDLPDEFVIRNKTLLEYCQLRIASYNSLYKLIAENNDTARQEFESYNQQIQAKINALSGKPAQEAESNEQR